ncbi:MAG: ComEC/Rec2 family competence protein [Paracoccaceae bacterium]|nr:ComEC/Rec2 family competence protein [Paracoccaceae bacterium]
MIQIRAILLDQRGALFEWIPICLAIGIGWYFLLRFEPSAVFLAGVGILAVTLLILTRWLGEALSPVLIAIVLIATGFVLAAYRAHDVASPVMSWRYYGPVEGRIVNIDRSGSDALRLTLDQVVLERTAPERTPERVRISLHGDQSLSIKPTPGLRVFTTAHVSPPGGPVEPGGFDFQRHAWFGQLGGVGYSRVPLLAISLPEKGRFDLLIFRVRMAVASRMLEILPGDVGGVAVAVTTGSRSAISRETLDDLRASNLAHLLAISGLHMGLLTGFVFALLRISIALIPPLALRVPARKMAAAGSLIVACCYLALSGGNVATERAFIMVAVALTAIMLNRRAISLRAVAIAATIVLFLRPEALLGPGFQMSFAATTALVTVFGYMRDHQISMGPNWAKPVVAVLISSGVAGIATAPIGAAHFNALSHYGLLANLTSVPMMGTVVIPAAVLAALLAPFGLDWIGLWIMGLGLRWILEVSTFVAGLDGARSFVHGPGVAVLPMIALGFLWLCLWQGRTRLMGVIPVLAAFWLWVTSDRPIGLIAENGTLVGIMTGEGRALSKAKGAGFVAQNWLENDGEMTDQFTASERWPDTRIAALPGGISVMHLAGKKAVAGFEGCSEGQIIVANLNLPKTASGCMLFDPARLKNMGAVAITTGKNGIRLTSVRDVTGDRLWTPWHARGFPRQ